jgi:hypothetical protein
MFLAFVGLEDVREPRPEGDHRGDPHQEWLTRAFREIWLSRPRLEPVDRDVERVKELLGRAWVDPQIEYYREQGRRHATASVVVAVTSVILFAGTIAAAGIHALEQVHGSAETVVVTLSIAFPAFAGALAGIAALEQHARHAEHFDAMARHLEGASARLQSAVRMETVRDVADMVETELLAERDVWVDVMRFEDVELPV